MGLVGESSTVANVRRAIQVPPAALIAVAALFVGLVYFLPIAYFLTIGGNSDKFAESIKDSFYWYMLGNTFLFAAKVTFVALLIAYPMATLAAVNPGRLATLVVVSSTIPLWTSLLARTLAWSTVLERRGIANTLLQAVGLTSGPLPLLHGSFAAILASVYIMVPIMVLSIYAPLRKIEGNIMRAARTLGARPIQAYARIFLPLSIPGVISGTLIVYIISLGLFVTPALMGGPGERTFSMLIGQQIDREGDFATASALSAMLLLATMLLLIVFAASVGFNQFVGVPARTKVRFWGDAGPLISKVIGWVQPVLFFLEWRTTWILFVFGGGIFLAAPYLALLPMSLSDMEYLQMPSNGLSLRWYSLVFHDSRWVAAFGSSLFIGISCAILSTCVGCLASIGLRDMSSKWANTFVVILLLPALLPTMIYSVAAYYSAAQVGLVDTKFGLTLAHAALAVPFVFVICATGLNVIDRSFERAAQSLGAARFPRFRLVILPLMVPSLLTGGLIAFQTSFDEVVVSLYLSGVHTRTLPKALWQASTLQVTPIIPAVAVLVLGTVLTAAALTLSVLKAQNRWAVKTE